MTITNLLIALGFLLLGALICYLIFRFNSKGLLRKAEEEAEVIKKNKIIEAKEKFIALKLEHENQVRQTAQKLHQQEQRQQQREQQLNQKQGEVQRAQNELNTQRQTLENQQKALEHKAQEVERLHQKAEQQLEQISGLSAEEAKKQLVDALRDEAKTAAMAYINDTMDEARLTANKEAKKIIIQSIQRIASETTVENAVTVFHIDNDEVKGRIIGREGRNIRALEAATGVEIVVDDTPEAITLSAFDPVRREIARLSLHQLVQDGRIHPARIEEVVAKVTKQVEEEIIETGKRTTIDLGIHGLHPELVRLVGKMKYRSSYGQNLLMHARETANLCAAMAAELGTMRVTEQIDALTTLSTNPFRYLIVPRILAGIVMLPILVLIGDIIGICGGYLIGIYKLDFNASTYLMNTWNYLQAMDIISGMTKAGVFGFIITLLGCYNGFYSKGGAQGVGQATTNAVVSASILILIFNYILTEVFFAL